MCCTGLHVACLRREEMGGDGGGGGFAAGWRLLPKGTVIRCFTHGVVLLGVYSTLSSTLRQVLPATWLASNPWSSSLSLFSS